MTHLHPPEWTTVLARLGLPERVPTAKTDAGRRVDRLVPRLNARASAAEIALSLLTAAASGPLRERLLATQSRTGSHHGARGHGHARRSQPVTRPVMARALALLGVTIPGRAEDSARDTERPDARLWRETSAAVAAASPRELDRDAAIDGLRQLYEKGRLSGERAEAVLLRLSEPGDATRP